MLVSQGGDYLLEIETDLQFGSCAVWLVSNSRKNVVASVIENCLINGLVFMVTSGDHDSACTITDKT